jgi:hypothetical protein
MGECKSSMKPTTTKAKSLLDRIKTKKKPSVTTEEVATTFVDQMAETYETLERLIAYKTNDLSVEKGQENRNKLALSQLETMQSLMERVVEKAEEYSRG